MIQDKTIRILYKLLAGFSSNRYGVRCITKLSPKKIHLMVGKAKDRNEFYKNLFYFLDKHII